MLQFIPKSDRKPSMKLSVQCPYCGESLMDEKHLIRDVPSIALLCKAPHQGEMIRDVVYFSAYHEDFLIETPLNVEEGIVTGFFCPHCESQLTSSHLCDLCQAPLVMVQLLQGGMLQFCLEAYERQLSKELKEISFSGMAHFCSRKGCLKHTIEFANPDADLSEFYESFAPFLEPDLK